VKLHPLSVPYRTLSRLGGVLVSVALLVGIGSGSGLGTAVGSVGAVLLGGLLVVGLWQVAYYRRFEYELTADRFDVVSGILSRRHREIPYDRIQTVDIHRNAVQRLLGIAALEIETAGGQDTEIDLRFVSTAEARRLDREIRERADGRTAGKRANADAPASTVGQRRHSTAQPAPNGNTLDPSRDSEQLFELSTTELALLSLLSFNPRGLSLIFVLPFLVDIGQLAPLGLLLWVVLATGVLLAGWALGVAATFSRFYGFRLTRTAESLQYERGLLQRHQGTMPLRRIQTMTVRANPLQRWVGYAGLSIETAGYTPSESPSGGSEAAVPLARRERVLALARRIDGIDDKTLERLETRTVESPPGRMKRRYTVRYGLVVFAGILGLFALDRFLLEIPLWYLSIGLLALVPVAGVAHWRNLGYVLGDHHVLTRCGFWRQRTQIVPYERLQTVIRQQSLFQRRWSVASVILDTAGRNRLLGDDAVAVDLETHEAERLHTETVQQFRRELDGAPEEPNH